MKTNPRSLAGTAGLVVVLSGIMLVWALEDQAAKTGRPGPMKLATAPLGSLIGAGQTPIPRLPPTIRVASQPMTGGATQGAKASADERSPKRNAVTPQPQSRSSAELSSPVSRAIEGPVTIVTSPTDDRTTGTTTPAEAEPQSLAAEKAASMQPGAVVANGQQAPALHVETLSSAQIRGLVASGKAFIVAENQQSGAVFVLDHPDSAFRPIRQSSATLMSNRYVPIVDLGLLQTWLMRLGQLPTERFNFGLRFSQAYNAAIAERQFASLVERGIDFAELLAAGEVITTHARFEQDLTLSIDRISVDKLARSPVE